MDRDGPHRLPPEWLELRQLRYFLAVAEELNFTRAAERLHLAQQALSAAIRTLEDDLGTRLFARSTRHVALTAAGEALIRPARAVLAGAVDAVDAVERIASGREGRLVIGFSTAAGTVPRVRETIRRFSQAASTVDLRLVEHDFSDPTAGLASGDTQVAFVFGPLSDPALDGLELLREPRLVALGADHPLATRTSVAPAELADVPWLRVPAPDSPWTSFWFRHPGAGESTGPEIRTADEWVPAIESGRGAAFTMRSVMAAYPNTEIATVEVRDLEPGTVLLAWRRDDPDPLVAAFLRAARGEA